MTGKRRDLSADSASPSRDAAFDAFGARSGMIEVAPVCRWIGNGVWAVAVLSLAGILGLTVADEIDLSFSTFVAPALLIAVGELFAYGGTAD